MHRFPHRDVEILMVEDNPGDVLLAREALSDTRAPVRLTAVTDGDAALRHLRGCVVEGGPRRPDLVLLDLNLPRRNGLEVLEFMKSTAELASVPVVVLSSSMSSEDVAASYRLQASCYIAKPSNYDEFVDVMQAIRHFWAGTVVLPGIGPQDSATLKGRT